MNDSLAASAGVLNLAASLGVITSLPDTWSDFVREVLTVTLAAYNELHAAKIAQRKWHEDLFSRQLYERMKRLLRGHPYLLVHYQHEVPTDEMIAGVRSLQETPRIDITFYENWSEYDYDRIYFAWEAKRVAGKGKYEDLRGRYVADGIFRFINGKYSADVPEAGMLGYVLDGEPSIVAHELNTIMLNKRKDPDAPSGTPRHKLAVADNLQPVAPINRFSDIYVSQHDRASGLQIKLYHLLLTFDFA